MPPKPFIPFNVPYVSPTANRDLRRVLKQQHFAGDGPATNRAVENLSKIVGANQLLLTPSCSHALELAMRLLELGPGDEVILPSFNFPSAANAVLMTGATPVFADVDLLSMRMTAGYVEPAITKRTRAVITLPYAGFGHDASDLRDLLGEQGIHLVEDAAHGLGVATERGRIGSFGHLAVYSFHETKNVQSGEGGALQVNDPALWDRARIIREKGTNRQAFREGTVDKYTWQMTGSSWLMNELTAGLLSANLADFDHIQRSRTEIVRQYRAELSSEVDRRGWFMTPRPCEQYEPAHLFGLVLKSEDERRSFIAHMQSHKIVVAFHYQPLHQSPRGRDLPRVDECGNSVELGRRLVRLPLFADMTHEQKSKVLTAISKFQR